MAEAPTEDVDQEGNMDPLGSEVSAKIRQAIKAKLVELNAYVDDELPDYIMVMVANQKSQDVMKEDLGLFLNENTEIFVNWLAQVLDKLKKVTLGKSDQNVTTLCSLQQFQLQERASRKRGASKRRRRKEPLRIRPKRRRLRPRVRK